MSGDERQAQAANDRRSDEKVPAEHEAVSVKADCVDGCDGVRRDGPFEKLKMSMHRARNEQTRLMIAVIVKLTPLTVLSVPGSAKLFTSS